MDALIEKLEAEIPEAMYETEAENFVRDYDNQLRMQGLDLQTYFQYTGMTLETLRNQFRPQAEKQVKARLALEKIAELENLSASEEDINGEYARIAEAYGIEVDQVKASIDPEFIATDMNVKLALDAVKASAVVKAPKKKTTKKAAPKAATTEVVEGEEKPVKKTRKTTKKATEETTEA